MSVRNNSKTQYNKVNTSSEVPYEIVRSDVFYYLKFVNYYNEIYKTASNLTSKPTVVFYTENSQTKVVLDYTLANNTDKKYISSFFVNMPQSTAFNLIKGEYLDKSENEANIGCTMGFISYKEDKVFATVSSITNKSLKVDTYFGDYFIGTPQLTKIGTLSSNDTTKSMALISVNPKTDKPLSSMGIISGDRIEIIKQGVANNQIRFEVVDAGTINDQEIIHVKGTPTTESYIGYPTILNVYVKGTTSLPKSLNGELGCCFDGIKYIPNSTEYQCSLRGMNFSKGSSCDISEPVNVVQSTNTSKKIRYTTGIITIDALFESSFVDSNMSLKQTYGSKSLFDTANNTLYFRSGRAYGFIQNEFSNFKNTIRFSTTQDFYTPYVDGVFGTIAYDGVGNLQYLYITETTPVNLYLFSESYQTAFPKFKIKVIP